LTGSEAGGSGPATTETPGCGGSPGAGDATTDAGPPFPGLFLGFAAVAAVAFGGLPKFKLEISGAGFGLPVSDFGGSCGGHEFLLSGDGWLFCSGVDCGGRLGPGFAASEAGSTFLGSADS